MHRIEISTAAAERSATKNLESLFYCFFVVVFFKELLLFPVKWIMSQKQNTEAELPGANENSVPPKVEPDHPTLLELAAK